MDAFSKLLIEASSLGWEPIQTTPSTDTGVPVWVLGGGFAERTLVPADGERWRHEMAAMPGNARTPLLWHPHDGSGKPPSLLTQGYVNAVPGRIPEDELPSFTQARQTLEDLVPPNVSPMVHAGFLRCYANEGDNNAKADRIEAAMRVVASTAAEML
jgi:hypothetical protein